MEADIAMEDEEVIRPLLERAKTTVHNSLPPLLRASLRLLIIIPTLLFLLLLSTFAFAFLHYTHVPSRTLTATVPLQYATVPSRPFPIYADEPPAWRMGGEPFFDIPHNEDNGGDSRGSPNKGRPDQQLRRYGQPHPYGIAPIGQPAENPISDQLYDVSVHLTLPRSPANLAAGPFMIVVELLRESALSARPGTSSFLQSAFSAGGEVTPGAGIPGQGLRDGSFYSGGGATSSSSSSSSSAASSDSLVVAAARRPAMLTYHAPLVQFARRILRLPFWAVGWSREEDVVRTRLMEGVSFATARRGDDTGGPPSVLKLEVQHRGRDGSVLEIYDARVVFEARFSGLRWLLYHHRITAFALLTPLFFLTSLLATFATFALVTLLTSHPSSQSTLDTKSEAPEASQSQQLPSSPSPSAIQPGRTSTAYPTPPPDPSAAASLTTDPETGTPPSPSFSSSDDEDSSSPTLGPSAAAAASASAMTSSDLRDFDDPWRRATTTTTTTTTTGLGAVGGGGAAAGSDGDEEEEDDFVLGQTEPLTPVGSGGGGGGAAGGTGGGSSGGDDMVRRRRGM